MGVYSNLVSTTTKYILKRLSVFAITSLAAITINFMLPRFMPGNPMATYIARMEDMGGTIPGGNTFWEAYKVKFGLDKDLLTQFMRYIGQLLQGDLGVSIMAYPEKVTVLIARSLPWTISLLTLTTIISWVIGNILGSFVGWSKNRRLNTVILSVSFCLNRIPYALLALILVFFFVYTIPLFPSHGGYDIWLTPGFNIKFITSAVLHGILPALSIIIGAVTSWMISMRGLIVTVLGEDYLMFAKAKGLKKQTILMKYAFRNALLPQVTGLALSLGGMVNGALLTEYIFAYPGIGRLFIDALGFRDYNLMQGGFLLITLSILGATLLIDILYPFLDPRIHYGRQ